jgi:hypothetical protein
MTNTETFKSKFPGFKGVVNFRTNEGEQINFIDVESNLVEFTVYETYECGCCGDYYDNSCQLPFMLDDMSNDQFDELCLEVAEHV